MCNFGWMRALNFGLLTEENFGYCSSYSRQEIFLKFFYLCNFVGHYRGNFVAVSKSLLRLQQEDISQPFANSEIRRSRIDRQGADWGSEGAVSAIFADPKLQTKGLQQHTWVCSLRWQQEETLVFFSSLKYAAYTQSQILWLFWRLVQSLNQSLQQLNNPSKRWRFMWSTEAKFWWKSSSLYPSFSDWIGAHFCSSICKFCGQLCTHIFGWLGINNSMTALNSGLGQQTTSFQNVFYKHIKVW